MLVHEFREETASKATATIMRVLAWLLESEPTKKRHGELIDIARAGAKQVGIIPDQARWLEARLTAMERPARPMPAAAWRAMGYCARAILAEEDGREVDAWRAIASAGLAIGHGVAFRMRSQVSATGAHKTHGGDRIDKEAVIEWLNANGHSFGSAPITVAALQSRSPRITNAEESTLLRWVRAWRKAHLKPM
jgi:hypothetical protein